MKLERAVLAALGATVVVALSCYEPFFPVQRLRMTATSHEPMFPLRQGAHAGVDCDACHGGFDTFTLFTCVGCHEHAAASTDPLHAGVVGYVHNATSCYACHPRGVADGAADHEALFPISAGPHSLIACAECHVDDYGSFSCVDCHDHAAAVTDPAHQTVGGYQYASAACYRCHPRGEIMSRDQHDPLFPIAAGPHGQAACADCHADGYGSFSCVDCHDHAAAVTDPAHSTVSRYRYASADCYRCHPRGEIMSRAQHDPLFPIVTGPHGQVACADCHADGYDNFSCVDCHDHAAAVTDPAHSTVSGYRYASADCYRCHPRGEIMSRAQHDPLFPIASGRHGQIACADCHATGYDTFSCIDCHEHLCALMNPHHVEVPGYHCDSPGCLRCHPRGVAEGN